MNKLFLPLLILIAAFSFACDEAEDSDSAQEYITQFRMGVEPDASYDLVQDTMISEASPSTPYGDGVTMTVRAGDTTSSRTLIKFAISGYIPPYATISRAVLSLYIGNAFGGFTISMHELTAGWNAATATWATSGSQAWTGGIYDAAVMCSKNFRQSDTSMSFDLDTGLVQEWVDDPDSNLGIILVPDDAVTEDFYAIFSSSDSTSIHKRPVLTVQYRL